MIAGAFLAQVALSAVMPFRAVQCPPGFDVLCDDPWLRLLVQQGTSTIAGEQGIILGKLYARDRMAAVDRLTGTAWDEILASNGLALVERYWGSYVAFLRHPRENGRMTISVLRAPLGMLGCYWHQWGEKLALASDPDLIVQAGLKTMSIDAPGIARHIAQPEIATTATCLTDLKALEGGARLTSSTSPPALDLLWSPWRFCDDRRDVRSHADAAGQLREVLIRAVAAQVADLPKSLVLLSGGFDSSILAACLHHAGHDFHALNLVTEAATGDERHFAQLAAQATHAQLTEVSRDFNGIDLNLSRAARGARPHARAFAQETERQAAFCAGQYDAEVVLDGGGGDNLFFNYMSLAALVEVLRKHGPSPRFWHTSAAFADLANIGLGSVAWRTAQRALLRDNRLRFDQRDTFLSPDMKMAVAQTAPHPWRAPPKALGAGKAAHVALLTPAQSTAEQSPRFCGSMPWISPFICQPVVETVLSLPIWCWFAPGLNRAAARLAFRNDLPAVLIERRTKGTPNAFVNNLFEKHRAEVRTMLLDGRLAGMGILDLDSLREVLDDPAPARDLQFARIMELVDAEAWARSWD